ncbi:MAG: peptidoglycan bridge formation protein FemAB, partial [Acidobacteriota bacterium]|nr:peptidoglycan bridge formation protein FemAB [Acidobacteriota bacterium]
MHAELTVTAATPADRDDWQQYVSSAHDEAGYHDWGWREVFKRAFDHDSIYLIARRDRVVTGVLPLVEIKSLLFGHTLTSLPFL